jgi:DinB family protein
MSTVDPLRYPVGPLPRTSEPLSAQVRAEHLSVLEHMPRTIRELVNGLTDAQLDRPYRPGGWTIRQVVHHVPDSHMHAYIRMKLAVTEEAPTAKTYEEKLWAELPEARSAPIEMSLMLLEGLHRRWVAFLRNLSLEQYQRHFMHAEWGRVTIDDSLGMYAWHCRHHTAHIANALK